MAVIYALNEEYTGLSAGVSFVNGKATTNDPDRVEWFSTHGYIVETEKPPTQEKPTVCSKRKKKGE